MIIVAFRLFDHPDKQILNRVLLYFDDVDLDFCHKFAGELLAINEFNDQQQDVKIDRN